MREIANQIANANGLSISQMGLRFDRVVRRLFDDLGDFAERVVPSDRVVLVTCTAPIRLARETVKALEDKIEALLARPPSKRDVTIVLFDNDVRVRILISSHRSPRLLGFVHNRTTDAKWLLDLMADWLSHRR